MRTGHLTVRFLATVGCASLLAGCPGTRGAPDAGADGGGAPSSVELCERLAKARCELKQRCYPAFSRSEPAVCVSLEQSSCLSQTEALRSSFENGLVEADGQKLATCEERMRTSACPPSFPPGYPGRAATAMADCSLGEGLLSGRVPSGETCTSAVECALGTVCIKPNGVCRGTCSTWPRAGDACAFGCGPGLICGKDGACRAPASLDEPCQSSGDCQGELICLGTCRPRRTLGESCQFDAERLSSCEPGLACDVAPFVANAQGSCVRPRAEGQPCRFHWSCQPGLVCADIDWAPFPAAAPGVGMCRPPDPESSNCPFSPYARLLGDQCGPGLACRPDSKKCKKLPVQGEACTPSIQDCSGFTVYCKPSGAGDVGVCTGPVGIGETCAFSIDAATQVTIPCATGACDAQATLTCRPPAKPNGALCRESGECLSGRCAVQQDQTMRCAPGC